MQRLRDCAERVVKWRTRIDSLKWVEDVVPGGIADDWLSELARMRASFIIAGKPQGFQPQRPT